MANVGPYHGAEKMRGLEITQEFPTKGRIGWFERIEKTKTSVPPEMYPGSRFGRMFPLDSNGKSETDRAVAQQQRTEELKKLAEGLGGAPSTDDNSRITTGFTFLGQFLGHDITFDPTSSLEQQRDVNALRNYRTPALDLDSLYGSGLAVSPHLYNRDQRGKFLLDQGKEFDLPRNSQETALIADPRNDGNLILAQLHLAFLKFHNAVSDQVDSIKDGYVVKKDDQGNSVSEDRFEKTQRLVRWHYQWIILREYLPLIVGKNMVLDILYYLIKNNGTLEYYKWKGPDPFIPVEFSVAAYRFGHSQVRSIYRLNDNYEVGVLPLFSPKPRGAERHDLQGGLIEKKYAVNWKNFFETRAKETPGWKRHSKIINTQLAGPLLFPPHTVVPNRPGEDRSLARTNLAERDLRRGRERGLPSGQEVASMINRKRPVAVLNQDKEKFDSALGDLPTELQERTPLWYYILKEAEVQHEGKMLGDVGGRIVAEVFIGLLQADDTSLMGKVDLIRLWAILRDDFRLRDDSAVLDTYHCPLQISQESFQDSQRDWRPTIPIERAGKSMTGDFTIVDLLKFAGVDTE